MTSERARRSAAAGGSSLASVMQRDDALMPQLRKWLDRQALRCLRACCREARAAVDCTLNSLSFEDTCWAREFRVLDMEYSDYELPSGVAAGVGGMVARGCRLHALTFKLPWSGRGRDHAASTMFGLGLLVELAAEPSLTEVTLEGLPLTAEVVLALAAAAPRPRKLALHSYDTCPQPFDHPDGVRDLLRHAAPHLQHLVLYGSTPLLGASLGSGLAAAATPLAAPSGLMATLLQQCSRLESLELVEWRQEAGDPNVLHALAQLPALRNLTLGTPKGMPAGHFAALSSLTRLTRLRAYDDMGLLLPGLAHLHNLLELDLANCGLRTSQLGQLAALTALTRLCTDRLLAPEPAPPAGGGVAGGPAPGLLLGRAWQVQLPPRLQHLSLGYRLIGTDVLAALHLPASLARVGLEGLELPSEGATDEDGVLRPVAAEAVLVACRELRGRKLLRYGDHPFELDLGSAKAPAAWQGLYGPLFAALRPLALRKLRLSCAPLTVRDVDSLVRQLPGLKELWLPGGLEMAALPLLHRLHRLRHLTVNLDELQEQANLAAGWANKAALGAVLLALCMHAPCLETLELNYIRVPHGPLQAAAGSARRWLAEMLPHVCSEPPQLNLISEASDDFDDDADGDDGV